VAFESLSEKLQEFMRKISGRGRIGEADLKEAMREVRMALLEADVNYRVVRKLIADITERALGQQVMQSITPGQQIIKIVNDELAALMGSTHSALTFSPSPPTVYMLCGLQGSGKTTTTGKLAGMLQKMGKRPMLAACDVYRPAAIRQLQIVGEQVGVPVFEMGQGEPVRIAAEAVARAEKQGCDVVLLDTAGRLHIDEDLMAELIAIRDRVRPQEILLVVDAMTGQDAVTVAEAFDGKLGIDGVILTKLDGDSRGGAALSVKAVTGKPIKYAATGEKLTDLEPFHPDRMASRILGMGDVLTLIEKAQAEMDEKKAEELQKKMMQSAFTLEDFLEQFRQMRRMGGITELLGMIPGGAHINPGDIDEKEMDRMEAIICSMTPGERANPGIVGASRKKRIARGSGTSVQHVNRLLKQFDMSQQLMKQLSGKGGARRMRGMKLPF
jgi:signal recognition particle subunit SRP54